MQGTGNKRSENGSSGRLLLAGHDLALASHSAAGYKAGAGGQMPVISLDTAKTVLMPEHLFEKGVETDYLRFNGMEPAAVETVIVSEPQDGIIAVMAVDAAVAELARREFGGDVRFTSPLLEIAAGRKRDVNILLTGENAYIAVWEKGLRMAEALPDNSHDSLLYYMQVLGRRFKLRRFTINISGEGASGAGEMLDRYFSKINVL